MIAEGIVYSPVKAGVGQSKCPIFFHGPADPSTESARCGDRGQEDATAHSGWSGCVGGERGWCVRVCLPEAAPQLYPCRWQASAFPF